MKTLGYASFAILLILIVYAYSPRIGFTLFLIAILAMLITYYDKGERLPV